MVRGHAAPGTSTPEHLRGGVKRSNWSTVCDAHILSLGDKILPNSVSGVRVSTGTRYASMISPSFSFSNQRYWLGMFFGTWRCTVLHICSPTRVHKGQWPLTADTRS